MKKSITGPKPANQYDKIFKENLQQALPGIIERILLLNISHSQDLPTHLHQTIERVTDTGGNTYLLHIEWQIKNDPEMVYRMAEYRMLLLRKYRLPVKQCVLYIGKGRPAMQTAIDQEGLLYHYQLYLARDKSVSC